jgi:cyclic pyranopterin phosphate synthase
MLKQLIDNHGRIGKKLRISVTDKCNMKCIYCMPTNNNEWLEDTQVLSFDEIVRLTSIFVKLGIKEIRITGGEPLTKPGLENLICSISLIPRINSIGLTTNGLLLADKIKQLISVGLKSVNISLDSFKESRFKSMSGITGVQKVINSIHKANEAGLHDHDRSILVPLLDLNFFQLSRISIVNNIHTANAMLTLVR